MVNLFQVEDFHPYPYSIIIYNNCVGTYSKDETGMLYGSITNIIPPDIVSFKGTEGSIIQAFKDTVDDYLDFYNEEEGELRHRVLPLLLTGVEDKDVWIDIIVKALSNFGIKIQSIDDAFDDNTTFTIMWKCPDSNLNIFLYLFLGVRETITLLDCPLPPKSLEYIEEIAKEAKKVFHAPVFLNNPITNSYSQV